MAIWYWQLDKGRRGGVERKLLVRKIGTVRWIYHIFGKCSSLRIKMVWEILTTLLPYHWGQAEAAPDQKCKVHLSDPAISRMSVTLTQLLHKPLHRTCQVYHRKTNYSWFGEIKFYRPLSGYHVHLKTLYSGRKPIMLCFTKHLME